MSEGHIMFPEVPGDSRGSKGSFIQVEQARPGSSDILGHCLLKTGLIIQPTPPARAISVHNEHCDLCLSKLGHVPVRH